MKFFVIAFGLLVAGAVALYISGTQPEAVARQAASATTTALAPTAARAAPTATTATPASHQLTLSLTPTGSGVMFPRLPDSLPLDRMLGIGDTATIRLGSQPVEVTLQTVELGERVSITIDIDRRIYTTFGFVNRGDSPVDFDPKTVFAGVPTSGGIFARANIMDPTDSVHLEPDSRAIRWRWQVSTRRGADEGPLAEAVWITLNAPIDSGDPS